MTFSSRTVLCGIVLLLCAGSTMASHNDIDILGGYDYLYRTYNIGYGSYNLNDSLSAGKLSEVPELCRQRC